jgi:ATP-dependent RNA helicase SUPV3L1/SUV3
MGTKAEALLGAARLNLADAMAWQRDAAKAGAPLSREPLAGSSWRWPSA